MKEMNEEATLASPRKRTSVQSLPPPSAAELRRQHLLIKRPVTLIDTVCRLPRMSQDKPVRRGDPIRYGDVFSVSGELAAKPITTRDAAAVESAEKVLLGETPPGAVSTVMKSVAELNESRRFVGHDDITEEIKEGGAVIAETTIVGHCVINESIGEQLLGRFAQPMELKNNSGESKGD